MSTEIPEPLAHPALLQEPTQPGEAPRAWASGKRIGTALFILGFAWVFTNTIAAGTALAAKIEILAPDDKVFYFGLATALAGIGTTISLFIWGNVSDMTRSRFGRRTPWIVIGGLSGALGVTLMGLSNSVSTLLTVFIGYGLLVNAMTTAVIAVFPDRIPIEKRGTLSAVYGGAQVVGGSIGGIVAAQFLKDPTPLFMVSGVLLFVGTILFVVIAPDHSSKDEPRQKLDVRGVLASFKFPTKAPDFYWAFSGRFLIMFGLYMVQNFGLYIMTDYIGLSTKQTQSVLTLSGLIGLVTIILGTFLGGPLSDKLGRRKAPIFVSSALFGVAVILPFIWPTATSMIINGALTGLALGSFLSVDAALMTEVLPSEQSRGKDMGILTTANTIPQIIAPLATAGIVGLAGYGPVFLVALVIILFGAFSIFKIRSVR